MFNSPSIREHDVLLAKFDAVPFSERDCLFHVTFGRSAPVDMGSHWEVNSLRSQRPP